MAYDFADLVQPWDYSVTPFPAQNGFCTRPVAPLQGSSVASLVSAEYPSPKQLLKTEGAERP
jgi:hypothetical protein